MTTTELTPRQAARRENLEKLNKSIDELKAAALRLGIPTRYLKSLDEMKNYTEQSAKQL